MWLALLLISQLIIHMLGWLVNNSDNVRTGG